MHRCVLTALLVSVSVAHAQTKQIHLRAEIITTLERGRTPPQAPSGPGLFLIQFEGHPLERQQSALRALGIDLLKYVPDDTFIARVTNGALAQAVNFNFVRWVGPYRAEHKIHPRLTALLQKTNAPVAVNILLSPRATTNEVKQVHALLSSVIRESHLRQGVIIRGVLPPRALQQLSALDWVLWIEPAPHRRLVDEAAAKLVGGDDGQVATPTVTEQMGYGGQGVTVCVADTGLDTGDTNTMHPDVRGRVTGFVYYPPLTDGSDGYGHGTHCAGIVAGNAATGETDPDSGQWYGLGVASTASLFIERIFDENANEVSPPPTDEQLTQDAVRNGAQIGANSWGNDVQGEYDTDASQFDELVRDADSVTPGDQPYILEFSAGNAGSDSQTLDSPATGKNVIATGASENTPNEYAELYGLYDDGPDTVADFSSRGPCEDGRIKPDLVAPGTWIASMASSAAPDESAIAWTVIDNYYVYMGGTSMSGPAAAGGAADFVQYYKATHGGAMPSPALVKAALINSAGELDQSNGGPGPVPNFDEGWGRVDLTNLIGSQRNFQYLDQSVLLTNGQIYLQHTFVGNSNQPLKITMAYTDVPGFPGAIPALVNDLNLEVIGPDGTVYRGNQFVDDASIPNPPSADNLNNVEAVHLPVPLPGNYLIRVVATNVVEDARLDTAAIDQDFALVVSGPLLSNNQGAVFLDRSNYTAPGIINLQVLDMGRAASNSVSIVLKSTTEPLGQHIVLVSVGGYGAFAGAVTLVPGRNAPAGELAIQNGDIIEADYVDTSGAEQSATATAVLTPPAITNVNTTFDLGVITITWQTSEPATSTVYYGANQSALTNSMTDPTLTTSHSLTLGDLTPGATYYFEVASSDDAGNSFVNNNSGAFYRFTGVATPAVLLVDAYETADGSPVIEDSTYTNALDATGFGFADWKVLERGAPVLANILPYRVVIWRTTDDIINYTGTNNTLTPAQQAMIQTYLNNGGSFFMSSMGILSQLGNVPFRSDVLEVAGFAQNPDPPEPCDCDEYFGVPSFQGAAGDPITGGMSIELNYTNYPSFDLGFGFGDDEVLGPDFGDTFTCSSNATPIAFETVSGKCCGMRYPPTGVDSPGRVVFLSFPIDTVPETGPNPDNETDLMLNILNFLDPGGNGLGTVTFGQETYTIPSLVAVEVGDSAIAGAGQAQAVLSSSSFTNRVTLTLTETLHAGIFRGVLTLVGTNTSAPAQLQTRSGDTISAVYFDAAANSDITGSATIDTNPPMITGVSDATNIGSAVVTWTTSEPADSTVQYGTGPILDHSASDKRFVTSHAVTLSPLQSSETYYFSVTSRDQAGNSATDDNQGALYTFITPKTLSPPWFDNLDTGAKNWTIVPDPEYGSTDPSQNWMLGTPDNTLVTNAHSGSNSWGVLLNSSVNQNNFFILSTYLYSPVIDLTGYSQATLTFWDAFDFTSQDEDGVIFISTNGEPLSDFTQPYTDFSGGASDGWEMESITLNPPYAGQPIQIVFYYEGVAIDNTLNGWVVDDVGITGLAAGAGGTIVVSKNIGSGSFSLGGPATSTGSGLTTVLSNMPPGQYSVQFGDVAFFNTPAPQTNTLVASNTVVFNGVYNFPDVNSNGMSDLYEQYYFGSVSSNRTRSTDTDGDGMTDYAEFIAGTNPTNAASNLKILHAAESNGVTTVQWSAIPGRIYQLQTSTNLIDWAPASLWMQALFSPMTYSWTNSPDPARNFRVEVRP